MAAELQNVQFWEASVPAGLRPTPAQNERRIPAHWPWAGVSHWAWS